MSTGVKLGHAPQARVAVVGGGLAGLAASCALSDAGYRVALFERRPYLGGRASSYEHPGTGEIVDNCQHVLLGCCTNLLDFYNRLGVADKIRWYDRLTFIMPGGKQGTIQPSKLPAPLHSSPAFLRFPLLSLADKIRIARAMLALMKGVPQDEGDFLSWLRRHGQSQRVIDRFWAPVLISSLNEDLDKVSVRYGAMVFRDGFLKSAAAGRMGVPTIPLSDLYGVAAEYITARGGEVNLRCSVEDVQTAERSVSLRTGSDRLDFDYLVSAVPFHALARLLPADDAASQITQDANRLETAPITGIHLWFDKEITPLEHAVLLDRTIQWMFQKSKIQDRARGGPLGAGSYLELVVSASKSLVQMPRPQVIELAMRELAEFFPSVKEARLLKATIVKEVHATFAPAPGSDPYRLKPGSPWPRVFLSGDWTDTGWPATMEGAVRAGYLSAQALTAAHGQSQQFLVPDLPPQGLMKLFP
ncbi:MAG TPA: hydroxysqualene dehydroxylase HpnE [candidate division Zixibacteria bacterium]|nr:hydroxysqualene dehydroxylase HpnE [candidate division Zixibacteria bacterium]